MAKVQALNREKKGKLKFKRRANGDIRIKVVSELGNKISAKISWKDLWDVLWLKTTKITSFPGSNLIYVQRLPRRYKGKTSDLVTKHYTTVCLEFQPPAGDTCQMTIKWSDLKRVLEQTRPLVQQ